MIDKTDLNIIKSDLVYHYCSLESFLKIVTSKKIRFSDLSKTNDAEEIKFLYSLLEDFFAKNGAANKMNQFSFSKFENTVLNKTFSFSMSHKRDCAQLWLNYANPGVSLEFNKSELIKHFNSLNFKNIHFLYGNIDYVNINDLGPYKDFFERIFNSCCLNNNKQNLISINMTQYDAPLLKNKGWSDEEEFRIYFKKRNNRGLPFLYSVDENELKREYETKNGYLKSYYDLPFDLNLIKTIFISSNSNITEAEIYDLLSYNYPKGHKPKIVFSRVKIRNYVK